MSVPQVRLPEAYYPNYGASYGARGTPMARPAPDDIPWTPPQRIPRLWKPGLASYSSLTSRESPPDASGGFGMARTPHIRPLALERSVRRGDEGVAILRPATAARIPPVLVPRGMG